MASVTLEIDDALGVVTISRPPLNLFTWEMLDELSDAIDQIAAAHCRSSVARPVAKSERTAFQRRS